MSPGPLSWTRRGTSTGPVIQAPVLPARSTARTRYRAVPEAVTVVAYGDAVSEVDRVVQAVPPSVLFASS